MKWELLKDTRRIITHSNCPDGMGSAIVLRMVFPHIEPEFYHHKQSEYLNLKAEPGMLFCDIIPPEHRYQDFVDVNSVVLDHHKGVEHVVEAFGERGVFADEVKEPGVSGTTLAWREVYQAQPVIFSDDKDNDVRGFAKLAGIRDTWQKDHEDFETACHQAAMLTFFSWDVWREKTDEYRRPNTPKAMFADEMEVGRNIYDKRIRDAKKCVDASVIFDAHGYKVAVFNDPDRLCSDVSEMHRKNGVDVIAGFYYFNETDDQHITYSLRSNNNVNVGEIAKFYGGGGHSKAAGFSQRMEFSDVNPFLRFRTLFNHYYDFLKS